MNTNAREAIMAGKEPRSSKGFWAMLKAATVVSCLWGCTTVKPGQYTLIDKKPVPTMNISSPRATALIFVNSKGERYIHKVFVDTFTVGGCYAIKKP